MMRKGHQTMPIDSFSMLKFKQIHKHKQKTSRLQIKHHTEKTQLNR